MDVGDDADNRHTLDDVAHSDAILLRCGVIHNQRTTIPPLAGIGSQEVASLLDGNTQRTEIRVIDREHYEINIFAFKIASPFHVVVAAGKDIPRKGNPFDTRNGSQTTFHGLSRASSFVTQVRKHKRILVVPQRGLLGISILQKHKQGADDEGKRGDKLEAQQQGAQASPGGRQAKSTLEHQRRLERGHVICRVYPRCNADAHRDKGGKKH